MNKCPAICSTRPERLYLTDSERKKFLAAADDEDRLVRSFCYVLAHTGCRISEALQLHAELPSSRQFLLSVLP